MLIQTFTHQYSPRVPNCLVYSRCCDKAYFFFFLTIIGILSLLQPTTYETVNIKIRMNCIWSHGESAAGPASAALQSQSVCCTCLSFRVGNNLWERFKIRLPPPPPLAAQKISFVYLHIYSDHPWVDQSIMTWRLSCQGISQHYRALSYQHWHRIIDAMQNMDGFLEYSKSEENITDWWLP